MNVRGETPLKSPEEAGENLVAFAEQAELGSPEFHTLSDYFDQQNLLGTYQIQLRIAEHPADDGLKSEVKAGSRLRITEMQIALLDHQIGQNKAVIPGYGRSFQFIESVFDQLGVDSIINPETPADGDESELYEFPSNSYHRYHTKVEEIIYEKRTAA